MTLVEDEYRAERDAKERETPKDEPDNIWWYRPQNERPWIFPSQISDAPPVHDTIKPWAIQYTRTDLIAAKDAEIADMKLKNDGLFSDLLNASKKVIELAAENDRLVRMLAEELVSADAEDGRAEPTPRRISMITKEMERIREELRGGGV